MKYKLLACFLFLSLPLCATHMRCGYISVEVISSISRTCRITITVFTDSSSPVGFGGTEESLIFGDGTSVIVPGTSGIPRPDLGTNVGMASYSVLHTYPGPGYYKLSYVEPNRNDGIINVENSVLTLFSVETILILDPSFGNFSTPNFLVDPFFKAKLGSEISLSVGAYSQEGFAIRYELTTPPLTTNYILPENLTINPFNGVVTWDTKFQNQYLIGEYLFAVKVHLYKVVDESMYKVSTIIRDFQIIVTDDGVGGKISDNRELDENNRVYIPENEITQLKIFYEVAAPTSLTAYSELLENEDAFSFTTYDSSTNENIKVGVLTLTNHTSVLRDSPYPITVRGGDGPFGSDIAYLFYTKDVYPQIITGSEDELADVELFPNPAKDFVSVSIPENQEGRVKVYNQAGQVIFDGFIQGRTSIDLQSFPSGFYYCRIQTGGRYKLIKLFKH